MAKSINMDRLLVADLGNQYGVSLEPDLFGLEIELEGKNLMTADPAITKDWVTHNDGSLHPQKPGEQGIEYVFRKPLDLTDTRQALENLFNYLNRAPGVKVNDSYRTSIHVHVNCLQETIRTIVNFLTLCIIFDELFVSQNGDTRIGNNFCLRSKDAEGQIADLCHTITQYGSLYNLSQNDRYSSTNFVSLLKFGTVEFRSLECTTDLKRVMDWVNVLQILKASARQYENPKEIIAKFSRRGPLGFMVSHLGDQYIKYAMVPGAHQMLQNGMRLAQDFAFCSEWKQLTKEEAETKKPRRLKNAPHQWAEVAHAAGYLQAMQAVPGGIPNHMAWADIAWPAVAPAPPQEIQIDPPEEDNNWGVVIHDDEDDDLG